MTLALPEMMISIIFAVTRAQLPFEVKHKVIQIMNDIFVKCKDVTKEEFYKLGIIELLANVFSSEFEVKKRIYRQSMGISTPTPGTPSTPLRRSARSQRHTSEDVERDGEDSSRGRSGSSLKRSNPESSKSKKGSPEITSKSRSQPESATGSASVSGGIAVVTRARPSFHKNKVFEDKPSSDDEKNATDTDDDLKPLVEIDDRGRELTKRSTSSPSLLLDASSVRAKSLDGVKKRLAFDPKMSASTSALPSIDTDNSSDTDGSPISTPKAKDSPRGDHFLRPDSDDPSRSVLHSRESSIPRSSRHGSDSPFRSLKRESSDASSAFATAPSPGLALFDDPDMWKVEEDILSFLRAIAIYGCEQKQDLSVLNQILTAIHNLPLPVAYVVALEQRMLSTILEFYLENDFPGKPDEFSNFFSALCVLALSHTVFLSRFLEQSKSGRTRANSRTSVSTRSQASHTPPGGTSPRHRETLQPPQQQQQSQTPPGSPNSASNRSSTSATTSTSGLGTPLPSPLTHSRSADFSSPSGSERRPLTRSYSQKPSPTFKVKFSQKNSPQFFVERSEKKKQRKRIFSRFF